jgi:hypothetical protein
MTSEYRNKQIAGHDQPTALPASGLNSRDQRLGHTTGKRALQDASVNCASTALGKNQVYLQVPDSSRSPSSSLA